MPHSPGLGAIYGIVAENGVPQEGSPVHLLDRTGPKFVRSTQTREDGGFAFSGLNTETDDYLVIATDETGGEGDPYKNALIRDRVQPVSVHVGTHYPSAWWSKFAALSPAVAMPAPYLDTRYEHVNVLSAGLAQGVVERQGGAWDLGAETAFPNSAINLPVIELSDQTWARVYTQSGARVTTDSGTIFTILVVADFSNSWGVTQRYVGTTDDYWAGTWLRIGNQPLCFLSFNGVDTIRFELPAYDTSNDTSRIETWDVGKVKKTYNHTLSSVPTGFALVAVSFRGGSVCNLYVDGTEVVLDNTTVPLQMTEWWIEQHVGYLTDAALHDWTRVGACTGPRFALYGVSPRFLYTAELDGLKGALENGGFPTETGYARAITVDLPAYYYRLDEFNSAGNKLAEHYEGDGDAIAAQDILFREQSLKELTASPGASPTLITGPTEGRSAMLFDATHLYYGNWIGGGLSYRNFTVSFWLRHDVRSGDQYILNVQHRKDDIGTKIFHVRIDNSGLLAVYLEGPDETISFTSEFALDTWYLVHIVVAKSEEEVRLFVDGVLVETIAASTVALASYVGVSKTSHFLDEVTDLNHFHGPLVIGGRWNESSVSDGFQGALAEVCGFTYPLTAARIADHYANKDVI